MRPTCSNALASREAETEMTSDDLALLRCSATLAGRRVGPITLAADALRERGDRLGGPLNVPDVNAAPASQVLRAVRETRAPNREPRVHRVGLARLVCTHDDGRAHPIEVRVVRLMPKLSCKRVK